MVWMAVIIKSISQIALSLPLERKCFCSDLGSAALEPLTKPKWEVYLIQDTPKPQTSYF